MGIAWDTKWDIQLNVIYWVCLKVGYTPRKGQCQREKWLASVIWFLKIIAKSEIIIAGDGSKTMKLEPLKFTKLN